MPATIVTLSDVIKELIRTATSIDSLTAIDFPLPPELMPPTGRFNLPTSVGTELTLLSGYGDYGCTRRGCAGDNQINVQPVQYRFVVGGFEIRPYQVLTTTPIFTYFSNGDLEGQGVEVYKESSYYLYEQNPINGVPGTGFLIAGVGIRSRFVTYYGGTVFEDKQRQITTTYWGCDFIPPRIPDEPLPDDDDDDDDDEETPPCDIAITSNFDAGYFCMTFEEYNRLMRNIRNIEQNLEQFR